MAVRGYADEVMNELALFAGAGGGILSGHLLGWRTVCAVEFDPYAASVLLARQNDGCLPPFPVWDDVRTFDGTPWRGLVDVVSGGFPCQDISAAGKRAGIDGERSGLWSEMARIIGEVRPRYVFVENSPILTSRGLGRILGDLATLGFDAEWGVLGASDVGAPHKRERIWIVANANGLRQLQPQGIEREQRRWIGDSSSDMADANSPSGQESAWQSTEECRGHHKARILTGITGSSCVENGWKDLADAHGNPEQRLEPESQPGANGRPAGLFGGAGSLPGWPDDPDDAPQSDVGRVAHGVAARVDRLKAIGNGQVPRVAAAAFSMLQDRHG